MASPEARGVYRLTNRLKRRPAGTREPERFFRVENQSSMRKADALHPIFVMDRILPRRVEPVRSEGIAPVRKKRFLQAAAAYWMEVLFMADTLTRQDTAAKVGREQLLDHMVPGFAHPFRSPILHRPSEADLSYQDVTFPSADGVPIEGWFIPCVGSDRLVVANHPLYFSRSGLPSHLEPWKSLFGETGNDFEVNFIPDFKILHDAGFNVLAYDFRNFGHSGAANGGIQSAGIYEARDVVGSLRFVRSHPETRGMKIALLSRCLGANATLFAMHSHPEEFRDICCLVAVQPLSVRCIVQRTLERAGIPDSLDQFNLLQKRITSFDVDEMSPREAAKSVRAPTFVYQVHDDLLTYPDDVHLIFDNIPATEKKLHWIRNSTRRWDGYCHFQREPEQALEWFNTHMA